MHYFSLVRPTSTTYHILVLEIMSDNSFSLFYHRFWRSFYLLEGNHRQRLHTCVRAIRAFQKRTRSPAHVAFRALVKMPEDDEEVTLEGTLALIKPDAAHKESQIVELIRFAINANQI